jgi:hypothetical protein
MWLLKTSGLTLTLDEHITDHLLRSTVEDYVAPTSEWIRHPYKFLLVSFGSWYGKANNFLRLRGAVGSVRGNPVGDEEMLNGPA